MQTLEMPFSNTGHEPGPVFVALSTDVARLPAPEERRKIREIAEAILIAARARLAMVDRMEGRLLPSRVDRDNCNLSVAAETDPRELGLKGFEDGVSSGGFALEH